MNNKNNFKLSLTEATYFLNKFRVARYNALNDSENFNDIILTIEEFGCFGGKKIENGLAHYEPILKTFVQENGIREDLIFFCHKFEVIRVCRNESIHSGVYARNITNHCIEITIFFEELLKIFIAMQDYSNVSNFMIANPVAAEDWYTVKMARNIMLTNSFTYIPIFLKEKKEWRLISETNIIEFMGVDFQNQKDRNSNSIKSINELINDLGSEIFKPKNINPESSIHSVKDCFIKHDGKPVLITGNNIDQLIGIITPYDIL